MTDDRIHHWFLRLLDICVNDLDQVWTLINYQIECEDADREALRMAFHNYCRHVAAE